MKDCCNRADREPHTSRCPKTSKANFLADNLSTHFSWMPLLVWEWDKTPAAFRNLSLHGGDEDWVALLPKGMEEPIWLERIGVSDTEVTELPCGAKVYIGAHA